MTDWADTNHSWEVRVDAVDQHNLENVRGPLTGVDLSQCEVTEGYDTDSRVQARIGTSVRERTSDGYVDKSRLRITLSVPEWGWSTELVTGFVTDIENSLSQGFENRRYTTDSVMWALGKDLLPWNVVCAQGQSMMDVTRWWLNTSLMPYREQWPVDRRYNEAKSYEIGESILSTLFDMHEGYNRLDMDGHGRLVIRANPDLKAATPKMTLNPEDPRTIIISDLVRSSDEWSVVSRVIVTSSESYEANGKTEHRTIAGFYDSPANWPSSSAKRGFTIGKKESYDGANEKPTIQEMAEVARQKLEAEQPTSVTWSFTTMFADLHAGDVISLMPYSTARKCVLTSVQTNLGDMTQKITAKEV